MKTEPKIINTTPDFKYLALLFSRRYDEALKYRTEKMEAVHESKNLA